MKYPLAIRILHWLTALIIISLIVVGYLMTDLAKTDTLFGLGKYDFYGIHKSFGVLVILLVLVRVVAKLTSKSPELPYEIKPLDAILAKLGHFALYVMMFLVPISGIIMSQAGGHGVSLFGLKLPVLFEKNKELGNIAHEIHEILPYVFAGLIVIHFLAVIKHIVIDKVNLLKRMF